MPPDPATPAPPPRHYFYRQLTPDERRFVDEELRRTLKRAKALEIRLDGADPAEEAADALARWIIISRPR